MSNTPNRAATVSRWTRFRGLSAAAVMALGGLTLSVAEAPGTALAAPVAQAAQDPAPSWAKYVLGPSQPQVYPVAVSETRGNVVRPEALIQRNGGVTLTTVAGQAPASVVLDFGQEMSGPAFMEVVRTLPAEVGGATPTLQVVAGEARSFLRRPAATTVTENTPAGATEIPVASVANLEVGNDLIIGTGATAQTRTIVSFATSTTTPVRRTVTVNAPLTAAVTGPVAATPTTPAVPGTAVTSSPGAPTSDENPGQALVGGPDLLTPTGPGRIETGVHPGFRYLVLTLTTPGSMTIRDLGVDFQAYRATAEDYQGWFESSDDELNRLWYAGAYTLQMNLKLPGLRGLPDGRIYDGAKRDGSIWTGDLIVQTPTAIATLGKAGEPYVKSSLEELLREQRADGHLPGSPDFNKGRANTNPASGPNAPYAVGQGAPIYYSVNYSGYGARSIIDYYRYAGDEDFAKQTLAQVEKAVAYNQAFLDTDKFLIAPRNPSNPSDPTYTRGDRDYFQSYLPGYVTKYSIDYYILLREMAWYERQIGSAQKAADYDATADKIKQAVTTTLWNQQGGFFGQSDLRPNVVSGDVNGLALQYGFVPKGQESRVLEAIKVNWNPYGAIMGQDLGGNGVAPDPANNPVDPTGHTIEPFGIGMETGGRLAVDDTAGAFDLMRRTWGTMIDKSNPLYTGAFWEFKNTQGGVNRTTASLAHGWAASPTVQLTEMVLGVKPDGPGYSTWTVKPHPGNLTYSKGEVPTETGKIAASWTQNTSSKTFGMQVTAPTGTSGTIAVPAAPGATVTVNGRTVWSNGTSVAADATAADGYVQFSATGGATVEVQVTPTASTPTTPGTPPVVAATSIDTKVKPGRLTTRTRPKVKLQVTSSSTALTGQVLVKVDGDTVQKAVLNGNGKATVLLDRLSAGKHRIVVVYVGTATTAASRDKVVVNVTRRL